MAHGLDARVSLQHSRALVDLALQVNPRSSAGHALKGLTELLESRLHPASRQLHLAQARSELMLAQTLGPRCRLSLLLRRALASPEANADMTVDSMPRRSPVMKSSSS